MSIHVHKAGLNKTTGQQSDAIYSTNLIGNFDPTAGIASTHWTNQAASNALRRFNSITFNTSAPKNFQFDGSDDYLGEASSGYGGTAFTMDTDSAFTVGQWYKHLNIYRHIAFSLSYSSNDVLYLSTGQHVVNKFSVTNDSGSRIDFSNYTFSHGKWYYITLVYHGSNNYSFFVNGSFVGSGTLSTSGVSGAIVQIGKLSGSTYTNNGIKVGHVHAHNVALKNSQIRQNMLATHDINDARTYGATYTA